MKSSAFAVKGNDMARVKYNALLMFTNQLSAMISANLPLARVLDGLSKESLSKHLLPIIRKLKDDVESGIDFGYAIAQHPKVFDGIYVNMVKAGMATGQLDRTLQQLTVYMQNIAETRGKLKSAFSYPIFMMSFLVVVFFIMVFKILPMFKSLFESFGSHSLPLPTRILMQAGDIVTYNFHWILLTTASVVALIIFILKNPTTRFYWDQYKLKFPLFGDLMKKSSMGKFLRAFSVLTQSEVLILDGLTLVSSAGYNKYLEYQINQVAEMIERGLSVAAAFQKTGFFPDIIVQMISSGEQTGSLGDLLENAANFYDDQVEEVIRSIVTLVNPLVTILSAGMVGMMMIAIFLPIFEMGSAVRG
ncbi:type II secretion system F family protein [Thermodesulfobacteriota bacterium]